jgi:hypothetical protein
MSTTGMFALNLDTGDFTEYCEFHNSWGSAAVVWGELCELKYNDRSYWLISRDNNILRKFWKLSEDKTLPLAVRAVFMMTFDRALITRKYFGRAVSDILEYLKFFPPNPQEVNHWWSISEKIKEIEAKTDWPAIGFHITSVSDNPLLVWNEETEDYYLSKDLYDLYDELDASDSKP